MTIRGDGARLAFVLVLAAGCGEDGVSPAFLDGGGEDPNVSRDLVMSLDARDAAPSDLAVTLVDLAVPGDLAAGCPGLCGDGGVCDVDLGVCRSCRGDAECRDPMTPVCDRISGRCQRCTPAMDVCPPGTYCG